jgi:hypothetical protein
MARKSGQRAVSVLAMQRVMDLAPVRRGIWPGVARGLTIAPR